MDLLHLYLLQLYFSHITSHTTFSEDFPPMKMTFKYIQSVSWFPASEHTYQHIQHCFRLVPRTSNAQYPFSRLVGFKILKLRVCTEAFRYNYHLKQWVDLDVIHHNVSKLEKSKNQYSRVLQMQKKSWLPEVLCHGRRTVKEVMFVYNVPVIQISGVYVTDGNTVCHPCKNNKAPLCRWNIYTIQSLKILLPCIPCLLLHRSIT